MSDQDVFAELLNGGRKPPEKKKQVSFTPVTRVTSATIARVKEDSLREELSAQEQASIDLAKDLKLAQEALAQVREAHEQTKTELAQVRAEEAQHHDALRAQVVALQQQNQELQEALQAASKNVVMPTSEPPLLDKPVGLHEKFPGEIREHVLATLAQAQEVAEQGQADRRARILEAVLGTNPPSGELESRSEMIRQIFLASGSSWNASTLHGLEKLGFRFIQGSKHNKLEYAGIRFVCAKTPSDVRAVQNVVSEICKRVY